MTPPIQGDANYPNASHTTTLGAIADSYVGDGRSSFTNYGRTTQLLARTGAAGANRITYLQFDLSSISTISSATLRLFGTLSQEGNNSLAVGVFAAAGSFNETKITWSNRPAAVGSALAQANITTAGRRWYQWDLTSYLRQQKQAGKTTVTLILEGLTMSTSAAFFDSREAEANGPQLVIDS